MRFGKTLLALALTLLASTAAAGSIVPAGAGGRYEREIDAKTKVVGFTPKQVTSFRAHLDSILGQLAAMPSVSAPPAPVCHRLRPWIELVSPNRVLAAELGVMSPISFERGRCSAMTGGGVILHVNQFSPTLPNSHAVVRFVGGEDVHWFLLPNRTMSERTLEFELDGDRTVVLTNGRAPVLRPVSIERYLREQLRIAHGGNQQQAPSPHPTSSRSRRRRRS